MATTGIRLREVVATLEALAPPALAEEWDKVGLFLWPGRVPPIRRILLTIDLTPEVAREAIRRGTDFIVAYHPPSLEPFRRLDSAHPRVAALRKLRDRKIPVYSPHTALDAVPGGVNDWLADALGEGRRRAIVPHPGARDRLTGQGRLVSLRKPVALGVLLRRLRRHLGVRSLRIARAPGRGRIKRVALCAGSGASVLRGVEADVYLTGEMKHHDVLDAVSRGIHVVLSEHTHTERGYLPRLRLRLREALGGKVRIELAGADREPIRSVRG